MLYRETSNHLDQLNLIAAIERGEDSTALFNRALEDVILNLPK